MTQYQKRKADARQEAMDWLNDSADHNYSYGELFELQVRFEELGRRFGLLSEFRENGII